MLLVNTNGGYRDEGLSFDPVDWHGYYGRNSNHGTSGIKPSIAEEFERIEQNSKSESKHVLVGVMARPADLFSKKEEKQTTREVIHDHSAIATVIGTRSYGNPEVAIAEYVNWLQSLESNYGLPFKGFTFLAPNQGSHTSIVTVPQGFQKGEYPVPVVDLARLPFNFEELLKKAGVPSSQIKMADVNRVREQLALMRTTPNTLDIRTEVLYTGLDGRETEVGLVDVRAFEREENNVEQPPYGHLDEMYNEILSGKLKYRIVEAPNRMTTVTGVDRILQQILSSKRKRQVPIYELSHTKKIIHKLCHKLAIEQDPKNELYLKAVQAAQLSILASTISLSSRNLTNPDFVYKDKALEGVLGKLSKRLKDLFFETEK